MMELEYICRSIGNLAGIPVRVFQDGKLEFFYSVVPLPRDPMILYQDAILAIRAHVGYFVTPHFNYYGIINTEDRQIVIGPTRQITHNRQELYTLAFRLDVPQNEVETFVSSMQAIVRMPLESVMQMLCVVNYALNGEKVSLEEICIYDTEQDELRRAMTVQQQRDEPAEEHPVHNTLDIERTITGIVSRGDTEALKLWLANAPAVRAGVMAADQLRQMKNTFIVTATLVSRAAIEGGMDVQDALSLSDAFIQKCELVDTPQQITSLQYHLVMEYTDQVSRLRKTTGNSALAMDVSRYVHHHLSEAITTDEIAAHLFMSRSHLSTKFRDETGMTLTDFILNEKTEEAKRLLCDTDKSLLSIGLYLGFSSQSHFTRVFRKYAGMTPGEYRKAHS